MVVNPHDSKPRLGVRISPSLSRVHATVSLAERVWLEDTGKVEGTTEASEAFRGTVWTTEELYDGALILKRRFVFESGAFGVFIGLVIVLHRDFENW